jgi:dihydrofolate reductase
MGNTIMGAVVSLDGYIADIKGDVGPLFDWYGNGDVGWKFTEDQEHPAAGDQVFVVTHAPPTDWEFADTAPFTFLSDGVEAAIARAREFAGDRDVDVAAGQIGGQALRLGLIAVVMNVVPVVFGAGRPFFGAMGPGDAVILENPSRVVEGDRVRHLLYDVVSGSRDGRE